jgi:hypothetical protein
LVKEKFPLIVLCVVVVLVAVVTLATRSLKRQAAPTKSQLVVAPDGTIVSPPNDRVTFVAELPKTTTNTAPTNASPTK